MNFKKTVECITAGKFPPKRAINRMERFAEAAPANDKKFLKKWLTNRDDMDPIVADFYRSEFTRWWKEEKSRSARHSSGFRKPRTRLKKESDEIIETVIRGAGNS